MSEREHLHPNVDDLDVRENPDLDPVEKETTIQFGKDRDRAIVHTDESGIARRLLAHPEREVKQLVLLDERGPRSTDPDDVPDDAVVVGVIVSLPVGALQIKASSRKSTQHADVVSERVRG